VVNGTHPRPAELTFQYGDLMPQGKDSASLSRSPTGSSRGHRLEKVRFTLLHEDIC
jgi:hypothetical protein